MRIPQVVAGMSVGELLGPDEKSNHVGCATGLASEPEVGFVVTVADSTGAIVGSAVVSGTGSSFVGARVGLLVAETFGFETQQSLAATFLISIQV
jgi:hypothetical protein